jgi:hypothetical protein
VTLTNRGQTYVITTGDAYGLDDPTGTFVTSDKPIAVFAGANLAAMPDGNWCCSNPLVQEQLPLAYWGTNALALSFTNRSGGGRYRVLAANANMVVFTNGVWAGANQPEKLFLDLTIDGPVEFQGNQPIQVAQFANSEEVDIPPAPDANGDPCEILLPPSGHYLATNIVFALPNRGIQGSIQTNYLNIIVAQSAIANTFVDGYTVDTTNFVAIGSSGYSGAQLMVTNGTHKVTSSQPVGVQAYGFGVVNAYGYFSGVVE